MISASTCCCARYKHGRALTREEPQAGMANTCTRPSKDCFHPQLLNTADKSGSPLYQSWGWTFLM